MTNDPIICCWFGRDSFQDLENFISLNDLDLCCSRWGFWVEAWKIDCDFWEFHIFQSRLLTLAETYKVEIYIRIGSNVMQMCPSFTFAFAQRNVRWNSFTYLQRDPNSFFRVVFVCGKVAIFPNGMDPWFPGSELLSIGRGEILITWPGDSTLSFYILWEMCGRLIVTEELTFCRFQVFMSVQFSTFKSPLKVRLAKKESGNLHEKDSAMQMGPSFTSPLWTRQAQTVEWFPYLQEDLTPFFGVVLEPIIGQRSLKSWLMIPWMRGQKYQWIIWTLREILFFIFNTSLISFYL